MEIVTSVLHRRGNLVLRNKDGVQTLRLIFFIVVKHYLSINQLYYLRRVTAWRTICLELWLFVDQNLLKRSRLLILYIYVCIHIYIAKYFKLNSLNTKVNFEHILRNKALSSPNFEAASIKCMFYSRGLSLRINNGKKSK